MGPSTEGPQCHMSILRTDHVSCHYFHNFPGDFKVVPYHVGFKNHPVSCHLFFSDVARLRVACQF